MPYPSWRYHRTLAPRVVRSPLEDDALGAEWADTPAAFAADGPEEPVLELAPVKRGPGRPKKSDSVSE